MSKTFQASQVITSTHWHALHLGLHYTQDIRLSRIGDTCIAQLTEMFIKPGEISGDSSSTTALAVSRNRTLHVAEVPPLPLANKYNTFPSLFIKYRERKGAIPFLV